MLRRVRSLQRPFALELHLALWIAIVKQEPAAYTLRTSRCREAVAFQAPTPIECLLNDCSNFSN